ncbi:Protein phosphatase Slingshot 2 [Parelaphostrongylus tenuis]|uniref:Protein phosphatase Slingshot 2 n=1 Tax=Parelaphostrongylus tenuis TaxID=148309 RepID=A0AAD5N7G0_PARTN|nr:Protein phosphatase Slingshot 2 [Parelaphostrongylus tenuis]
MSLVQVQRSPSPSIVDESEILEFDDSRCSSRNRSISECYFAVRGAAVILPHGDNSPTSSHGSANAAEIEGHLQLMLRSLRPQDKMSMAVRLQTQVSDHARYLAVVSNDDNENLLF